MALKIEAGLMGYQQLNEIIRSSPEQQIIIEKCIGQRYIGTALKDKSITVYGTPGNALGSYLNGAAINVFGNAQEGTGDTMNSGSIFVHGSCGDATGYAMRGGQIFIHGDSGYRTGIHMKAYKNKLPVIVIGGAAGSFLGEYQAGGIIIVLGKNTRSENIVGNFCGTGMHGGKIFLRCSENELPHNLPSQVAARPAADKDLEEIKSALKTYCAAFSDDIDALLSHCFYVLEPSTKRPYHQLYTYTD